MQQQPLFVEDIYEAIRHAVQWLGGAKVVGHDLWPSLTPHKAAEKLNDCLNRDRAQKLDLEEFQRISKQAASAGCHVIHKFQSQDCGYKPGEWQSPDLIAEKKRERVAELLEELVPLMKGAGVEL